MNGVHDLGGMQDFGPVEPEADEPVFHADWERRALALTLAMAVPGGWSIDASRRARENLPPLQYLSGTYYETWLSALSVLLAEHGLVTPEELDSGRLSAPAKPVGRILAAEEVPAALAKGGPVDRPASAPARFSTGDPVRARNMNPRGHTRLPRYARGRLGEVVRVHGCHVYPDSSAYGLGEQPQWLYCVRFSARELWGEDAPERDTVHIDLWEPYLEPA
jgi:nitrile hydratase subunit beta